MSTDPSLNYLLPGQGTFWGWNQGASVITWKSGETLAIYAEVEICLRRLAPRGLPSMDEMLLVLAATRRHWLEPKGGAECLRTFLRPLPETDWEREAMEAPWPLLFERLEQVHRWSETNGFRSGNAHKILEMVFFQPGPREDQAETIRGILRMLDSQLGSVWLRSEMGRPVTRPPKGSLISSALNLCRRLGSMPLNTDLEAYAKTGLPDELAPVEVDPLPLVERIRGLATQLLEDDDSDLAGIARIAQSLSAVVQLPRPLHSPDELPMGGYSDIANRGSFDRLLVSELAQDPDVLAVRVSLNEALYLRRESPPRQPPRRRAIFVDVGVRLWGLPRVFANSLALAFAMQTDPRGEVLAFTSLGGQLSAVRLDTREGLVDLLGRLAPEAHPREAVTRFLEQFGGPDSEVDCVVITHPKAVADPDFRRGLGSVGSVGYFLATVDGDGNYVLRMHSALGSRELQHATLDLGRLMASPSKSHERLLKDRDRALPLILRQLPFPLLFGGNQPVEGFVYHQACGTIGFTKDGLLFHWKVPHQGGKLISDHFPRGVVSWKELDGAREQGYFLIPRHDRTAVLIIAVLEPPQVRTIQIHHGIDQVRHTFRMDDVLLLAGLTEMAAVRMSDGCKICSLQTQQFSRASGRFFRYGTDWFAAYLTANRIRLEPAPKLPGADVPELIWEKPGRAAPLAMLNDLSVLCLTDPPEPVLSGGGVGFRSVVGISTDGSRVLARVVKPNLHLETFYLANLDTASINPCYTAGDYALEPQAFRMLSQGSQLRKKYQAIRVSGSGQVHLLSRKGGVWALDYRREGHKRLEFVPDNVQVGDRFWRQFDHYPSPAGTQYALRRAIWDDGSTAFLDHRGMLHLKSADPNVPEVTLILKDHMLSGWTSEGEFFGAPVFIGDHPATPPEKIHESIQRFTAHILSHVGS